MAYNLSTQCDLTNSNMVFLNLAMKIDSSLHPNIQQQLKNVELINGVFDLTGREELIPVGSCMDGSKVNTPTDFGDVDILLVPKKFVLDEKLFDYDPYYPAFLHVRGERNHAKIFKKVKLIDDCHVPVMDLKKIQRNFFHLVPLFIHATTSSDVHSKRHTFNAVKRSGVGLEFAKLDFDSFDLNGFIGQQGKGVDKLRIFGKFIDSTLDVLLDIWVNKDTDTPMQRIKRKKFQKECSSTHLISSAIKAVDFITGEYEKEQSDGTSPSCSNSKIHSIEYAEIDPEDGVETIRYNNNLDIDGSDESYGDNDNSTASMPIAIEPNFDEGDSDDQTMSLPKLLSADLVPAFKFDDWPSSAAEWLKRKRQWPSKEIVQQVVESGCHIVAKRPLSPDLNGYPANEDNSPESDKTNISFRLSFSKCELRLANSLIETQIYCWRVLKAYQKKYLRTEPKVLASYHWKNVMFWVIEETDPSFWTEDNVLFGVCKALDFMIRCLRERFIPVYFVRNENLIAGCKHEVIEEALARVISIRKNPIGYLQLFIESPPLSPPYRVSRTTLAMSIENKTSKTEYLLDTIADLVREIPELATVEEFDSRIQYKVVELWQLIKTRLEENETSNKSSVFFGNVDRLLKQIVNTFVLENNSVVVGDSMTKRVVETAASILPILANKTSKNAHIKRGAIQAAMEAATAICEDTSVDRVKVIGGLLSAFTSTIDDHLKANPESTFSRAASSINETVQDILLNVSKK
ncbi:uncharacterized protein LOC128232717 [Mya arenaria]|uniref:uncharacterized protein LOC128232717 n=1 Tax=Mya arenaria TaxID=6604 RepID=UPI0022DFA6D2|nr:uncharacterized protein LOC128232717 [Mya arenaria]